MAFVLQNSHEPAISRAEDQHHASRRGQAEGWVLIEAGGYLDDEDAVALHRAILIRISPGGCSNNSSPTGEL